MANILISFRDDDTTRQEAMRICEQLGISLQDYLRMCMARLVKERGIPFSMRLDEKE